MFDLQPPRHISTLPKATATRSAIQVAEVPEDDIASSLDQLVRADQERQGDFEA
jgi:hypothetical protein